MLEKGFSMVNIYKKNNPFPLWTSLPVTDNNTERSFGVKIKIPYFAVHVIGYIDDFISWPYR